MLITCLSGLPTHTFSPRCSPGRCWSRRTCRCPTNTHRTGNSRSCSTTYCGSGCRRRTDVWSSPTQSRTCPWRTYWCRSMMSSVSTCSNTVLSPCTDTNLISMSGLGRTGRALWLPPSRERPREALHKQPCTCSDLIACVLSLNAHTKHSTSDYGPITHIHLDKRTPSRVHTASV